MNSEESKASTGSQPNAECGMRFGGLSPPSPRPSPPGEGAGGGTRHAGAGHGHYLGLRNARNNEKAKPMRNDRQANPNPTKSDQIKSNQTKPDQQIKAPAVRSHLARTNRDF